MDQQDKSPDQTRFGIVNMKTTSQLIPVPVLAIALAIPAAAIEAPVDDAPAPAAQEPEQNAGEAPKAKHEPEAAAKDQARQKSAYLGVVTTEVPEMLNDHLGLKAGEGIIVRSVMPDGPADKAGIRVHDVITRVDDEVVASAVDLTGRISAHKPGDKVRIDVIQKGKAAKLEVGLGVRPDQFGGINLQPLDNLQLDGMPEDMAGRIRRMIEGNVGGLDLNLQGNGEIQQPPQIEDAMREMRQRMEKALGRIQLQAPGFGGKIEVHQGATFKMMDEQGSVEIKSNEGSKEVTVRDKENEITWNGPWDTDQDKAAAPDDIRARVERLNINGNFKGNGFRFRMGPGGIGAE
jgi:serine protease Do